MMEKHRGRGRVARDETFDDFLDRDGMLAEVEELALKEIIADQIREAMKGVALPRPSWRHA